ncbi:hypothetical protein M4I21_18225 [Cellulophaga sp. 20_2_10]|uniref:hypothetical protein n=1 Tax=Cellulophaga sp. 20_2_10 TaxID=2942476 RepID=UPI00201A90C4|nr:hypothetical protein [Cellulophaga sp. 20_2_10]MCL5247751.1 hypothetical protein [Cellulophaga sp. 20_2_10]
MKITKTDIKILVDLYKSIDGLTPYAFFQRYKYTPTTVFKSTSRFQKMEFIVSQNDKLLITEKGKEFVQQNRFIYSNNKFDRIPEEFLGNKIGINVPYIPNLSKISKEILNLQNNKGDG